MKLYAISDLHLANPANREALNTISDHPRDWLILGGDVGETAEHMELCFRHLMGRFARLIWVPGNHELWTIPRTSARQRGQAKYDSLVALCRSYGVLTPEDPYPVWQGEGGPCVIAPLFVLYDYSFRPSRVPLERVLSWAEEKKIVCTDEILLHPDPYPSRQAWCMARCALTERRLARIPGHLQTVLINHFPMRRDLLRLRRIPRFAPWCGTTRSEDWHRRFRARVVVTGHLHVRGTAWRDGTRFEEVSLGYPRDWDQSRGMESYLREILPGEEGQRRRRQEAAGR
ncbi:MAG: metallophosphoesterase [Acidobacteriota bacterium]